MDDMSNEMADEFNVKKPKKRHTFLIIFICLIIGIIGGGAGVGYYLVEVDNPFAKEEKVKKDVKPKETQLKKDNYLVKTLINKMHSNITYEDTKLYASEFLSADDLDSNFVNYLVINEAKRQQIGKDVVLDKDVLEESLNAIFGPTTAYVVPEEDFGECPKFTYDSEKGLFNESTECDIKDDIEIASTIIKAVETSKKIEIYEAVAFINKKDNKVYTKVNANGELSEEVKDLTADNFIIGRDYNHAKTYKYTFSYNESDNNYVFESLSLEK